MSRFRRHIMLAAHNNYKNEPLRFVALENNSSVGLIRKGEYQTIQYSFTPNDTSSWVELQSGVTIPLNSGDTVYMKGTLTVRNRENDYTNFSMTGRIAAYGNIMRLWNETGADTYMKAYCGYQLFQECNSLVTPPDLPGTHLNDACYAGMFFGCENLEYAPSLPATTLVSNCYYAMFYRCTSIETAPSLPATTLADYCYYAMFAGCTNLDTVPQNMLSVTTLANSCYGYMFYGCTSLTNTPVLPATTLTSNCYYFMFNGCTILNYIKCLATNISASSCTSNWVKGVQTNNGTFVCPNFMRSTWDAQPSGNGKPSGWQYQDS